LYSKIKQSVSVFLEHKISVLSALCSLMAGTLLLHCLLHLTQDEGTPSVTDILSSHFKLVMSLVDHFRESAPGSLIRYVNANTNTNANTYFLIKPVAPAKYALVAKESVIFGAVFDRPGASQAQLNSQVLEPTLAFLAELQNEGYVVIDTTLDSNGNMGISAIPNGAIDLTEKLKARVQISQK
jgi:hypothetical protein